MEPRFNGRALWAHRGALAQQRKYPGREWTVNGMNAMRVWWIVARQCVKQVKTNWPELYAHIEAKAIEQAAQSK